MINIFRLGQRYAKLLELAIHHSAHTRKVTLLQYCNLSFIIFLAIARLRIYLDEICGLTILNFVKLISK